jgi:hypothetical protein
MHKFDHTPADKKRIVGVGSALVDILAYEDEDFLNKTGGAKGGMTYVGKEFIEQTLEITSKQPTTVPGGSACNTIVGVGKLGGSARFVGKCGIGKLGKFFKNELKRHNVEPMLFRSNLPTGMRNAPCLPFWVHLPTCCHRIYLRIALKVPPSSISKAIFFLIQI